MGKISRLTPRRLLRICLATAIGHGAAFSALAQPAPGLITQFASDSVEDPSLLEPIFGPRPAINVEPVYYGEVFTNTKGGVSTNGATRYNALLDLPVVINFDKMDAPLPGRFFLLAQNTHGRGLTQDFVGDTLVLSNIDSGNNIMQVSEYWWEFPLFEDNVSVRLGKQDINTEFKLLEYAADFIQSSFGLSPSETAPTYPNPSMGVVVLNQLTDSLQFKIGVWDSLAEGGTWGFSGNNLHTVIAELQHTHALDGGQLPGSVEIGAGFFSSGDVNGESLPEAHGYYVQVQQYVFREFDCCDNSLQGLALFGSFFPRFGESGDIDRGIENSLVLGMTYRGPIPGRNQDVVGVGYAWAKLNQAGPNDEEVIEFFYKAQLTDFMSLQPDLQFIGTPSGIYPDSLVAGFRFEIAL